MAWPTKIQRMMEGKPAESQTGVAPIPAMHPQAVHIPNVAPHMLPMPHNPQMQTAPATLPHEAIPRFNRLFKK